MKILNVQVDPFTQKDAIKALFEKQVIFTPNPEILLEAGKNKTFRRALKKGTMMLPDGHGLLLISTLMRLKSKFWRFILYLPASLLFLVWKKPFKKVIPEIIHGSDFMAVLVAWAEAQGKSVYFLGADDGVAEATAKYFKSRYGKLKVAGHSSADPSFESAIEVKKSGAEVLLVAYGAPKQEIWVSKYLSKMPNLHTVMCVGGSFDFWSGKVKRAPEFFRKSGLEWLWRLFLHPKERVKRIWNATVKFPITSLFYS